MRTAMIRAVILLGCACIASSAVPILDSSGKTVPSFMTSADGGDIDLNSLVAASAATPYRKPPAMHAGQFVDKLLRQPQKPREEMTALDSAYHVLRSVSQTMQSESKGLGVQNPLQSPRMVADVVRGLMSPSELAEKFNHDGPRLSVAERSARRKHVMDSGRALWKQQKEAKESENALAAAHADLMVSAGMDGDAFVIPTFKRAQQHHWEVLSVADQATIGFESSNYVFSTNNDGMATVVVVCSNCSTETITIAISVEKSIRDLVNESTQVLTWSPGDAERKEVSYELQKTSSVTKHRHFTLGLRVLSASGPFALALNETDVHLQKETYCLHGTIVQATQVRYNCSGTIRSSADYDANVALPTTGDDADNGLSCDSVLVYWGSSSFMNASVDSMCSNPSSLSSDMYANASRFCGYWSRCQVQQTCYNLTSTMELCSCTLDYNGRYCDRRQPVDCRVSMISPTGCANDAAELKSRYDYDSELNGSPACLYMQPTMNFQFKVRCEWGQWTTVSEGPDQQDSLRADGWTWTPVNFSDMYHTVVYGPRGFAQSKAVGLSYPYLAVFKPFNMMNLRDDSYMQVLPVVFSGQEAIVPVTLAVPTTWPRGFLNGGRVTTQVRVRPTSDPSLLRLPDPYGFASHPLRFDMDDANWSMPPPPPPSLSTGEIAGIVIGVLVGVGLCVVAFLVMRKREMKKSEQPLMRDGEEKSFSDRYAEPKHEPLDLQGHKSRNSTLLT